jgi:hypothetical protein
MRFKRDGEAVEGAAEPVMSMLTRHAEMQENEEDEKRGLEDEMRGQGGRRG